VPVFLFDGTVEAYTSPCFSVALLLIPEFLGTFVIRLLHHIEVIRLLHHIKVIRLLHHIEVIRVLHHIENFTKNISFFS
jgi:hypothetical protein